MVSQKLQQILLPKFLGKLSGFDTVLTALIPQCLT